MASVSTFTRWRGQTAWYHQPLGLALLFWVTLSLAVAIRTLHRPDSHTVFPVFALGSQHWWADTPLYDDYDPIDYFRYPPLFAILFTPLASLGSTVGGVLWSWLSVALYLAGCWQLARHVLPGSWPVRRFAGYVVLAGIGALAGFWNAQSNALLTGLLLLGMTALLRERWWSASFLLALPVALKFTPMPLVLLLCALYPTRLTARIGLILTLCFLLPFLTRPAPRVVEQYAGWWQHLVGSSSDRWPGFRDVWTIVLFVREWLAGLWIVPNLKQPIDAPVYRLLQALGGLAVLGVVLRLQHRGVHPRALITVTYALGAVWLMLLGPAVEAPTYAFVAPVLAWAVVQRDLWPAGWRWATCAGVLVMVFGWAGLTRPLWLLCPPLVLALPLGTLCLLGWIVGLIGLMPRYPLPESAPGADAECNHPGAWPR